MENRVNKVEFAKIYRERIFPYLKNMEPFRDKMYKRYFISKIAIFVAIICFFLILCKIFASHTDRFLCVYIFTAFFGFFLFVPFDEAQIKKQQKFMKQIKQDCLPRVFKIYNEINIENLDDKILYGDDCNYSIFQKYLPSILDDKFSGKYRNVPFCVAESPQVVYVNGVPRKTQFAQSDIYICLKNRKMIKNKTAITDKFCFSVSISISIILLLFLFLIYQILTNLKMPILDMLPLLIPLVCSAILLLIELIQSFKGGKIRLEDVNFEKRFKVDSEDQIESRCILTPTFIEKFTGLKTFFKANRVTSIFEDDNIIFILTTRKDILEFGKINKSLLDFENYKNILFEIDLVCQLIDYFNFEQD